MVLSDVFVLGELKVYVDLCCMGKDGSSIWGGGPFAYLAFLGLDIFFVCYRENNTIKSDLRIILHMNS